MAARIITNAPAEPDVLADWMPYLAMVREAVCIDPDASVADLDAVTVEEIDKLLRRACITPREATQLLRALDVPPLARA